MRAIPYKVVRIYISAGRHSIEYVPNFHQRSSRQRGIFIVDTPSKVITPIASTNESLPIMYETLPNTQHLRHSLPLFLKYDEGVEDGLEPSNL